MIQFVNDMLVSRLVLRKGCRPIFNFIFLYFLTCISTSAEVRLNEYFQNGMVIQQNEPIIFWGKGVAGETVFLDFGGEKLKTTVTKNGLWAITSSPRIASFDPVELAVNNHTIENILIGEVWLCSGQSNMGMTIGGCAIGEEQLNTANYNKIRFYNHKTIRLVAENGYSIEELNRCNVENLFEAKWSSINATNIRNQSAVSWIFASNLMDQLKVPVGIIYCAVGGSAVNSWIPKQIATTNPVTSNLYVEDWLNNDEVFVNHRKRGANAFKNVISANQPYIVGELSHRFMCEPDILFEASISKISKVKTKGIIWYQGEADAFNLESVKRYEKTLPLMMEGWRNSFQNKELPFILIQLPKYEKNTWPNLREVQQKVATNDSNSYLVSTIDLGNESNVHPKDKIPVGNRVTYVVLNNVYGMEAPKFPVLLNKEIKKDAIILEFDSIDHSKNPKKSEVIGFETVTKSGELKKVSAAIEGLHKIRVQLPPDSKVLRYQMQPVPKMNVFNKEDLPIPPFSIDLVQD